MLALVVEHADEDEGEQNNAAYDTADDGANWNR
jgi:hypothetical protein